MRNLVSEMASDSGTRCMSGVGCELLMEMPCYLTEELVLDSLETYTRSVGRYAFDLEDFLLSFSNYVE